MASTNRLAAAHHLSFLPPLRLPPALATDRTHSIPLRWIATRALMLMLLASYEQAVVSDTSYYGQRLHTLVTDGSLHNTLIEYPLPVLLVMFPQFLLAGYNQLGFGILFAVSMLAVDAFFTFTLWRADGRRRGDATNFWLWFVPCIGPLAYFRFDLIPAALAGTAILVAARRPATSGALTAFGAGLKLWPAIMLPAFLLRRTDRRSVVIGFVVTGLVLGLGSLLLGGISRTLSPIRWQSQRGLQIEAVIDSPLILARSFHSTTWPLRVSRFQSWEIFGPLVGVAIALTTVFTALGLILLAVLWLRARAQDVVPVQTLSWLFFATALIVTITNKALSPQYILWLGGPLAGLASRAPGDRAVRKATTLLLVIAFMTQLIFPIYYADITSQSWRSIYGSSLLVARNVLLVYLTYFACKQVWNSTHRSTADSAE